MTRPLLQSSSSCGGILLYFLVDSSFFFCNPWTEMLLLSHEFVVVDLSHFCFLPPRISLSLIDAHFFLCPHSFAKRGQITSSALIQNKNRTKKKEMMKRETHTLSFLMKRDGFLWLVFYSTILNFSPPYLSRHFSKFQMMWRKHTHTKSSRWKMMRVTDCNSNQRVLKSTKKIYLSEWHMMKIMKAKKDKHGTIL